MILFCIFVTSIGFNATSAQDSIELLKFADILVKVDTAKNCSDPDKPIRVISATDASTDMIVEACCKKTPEADTSITAGFLNGDNCCLQRNSRCSRSDAGVSSPKKRRKQRFTVKCCLKGFQGPKELKCLPKGNKYDHQCKS